MADEKNRLTANLQKHILDLNVFIMHVRLEMGQL